MRIAFALVLVFLALPVLPAQAGQDGSIDLFPFGIDPSTGNPTTPDFGSCQATVTSLFGGFIGRLTFGVYARLAGVTQLGFSSAELYLTGLETDTPGQLPTGWLKTTMAPSATFSVGLISDPATANGETLRRWNLFWIVEGPGDPDCQRDPLVLLATVDLYSNFGFTTNFADNHYVSVVAAVPSVYPPMGCPLLTLCDYPVYTNVCVSGGQLIINPAGPSCTVAVEQATWSQVKGLYR